ncbi:MAG: leucine-rich repeat domain-containing protein [Tannerellaceae bacterium]|jgi:hypothetical protein|nr:leucine-rich repeat domain-containing protein [Tannerellaceae bacterium]
MNISVLISKHVQGLLCKRILLLFTVLLITASAAEAQFFRVGDFAYRVNPDIPNTVAISGNGRDNVKGSITLPSVFRHEGVTYAVKSVHVNAFREYRDLISVVIPPGITDIGEFAFYYCLNLESIVIPPGVTGIGRDAFSSCNGLTSLVIPQGVKTIGESAFFYCRGLASVSIPQSVTDIGELAFAGCKNLKQLEVKWSVPPDVPSNIFAEIDLSGVKLIVPPGAESRYRQAELWRNFGTIE